jgi:hypothetical protein
MAGKNIGNRPSQFTILDSIPARETVELLAVEGSQRSP